MESTRDHRPPPSATNTIILTGALHARHAQTPMTISNSCPARSNPNDHQQLMPATLKPQ